MGQIYETYINQAPMNTNSHLLELIQGCLNPNLVSASERALAEHSRRHTFLSELLQLVPNQPPQNLIMILSTLKNFLQQRYRNPIQGDIPEDQKSILRENLFNFFYEINQVPQAVNLYKEIVFIIISVDYEQHTALFYNLLKNDLEGSIMASVYFCRQVSRFYEWLNGEQRQPLEVFINDFFPRLETLVQRVMSNYNEQTRVLLNELLQMFYSSFHIEVPLYLRNFSNIQKWMLYLTTILKAPVDNYPNNHIEVSRIYVKLFSMYLRDGTDGKQYRGWGAQFRTRYAQNLYNEVIEKLVNPIPDEDTVSNMVRCLTTVVNNVDLRPLMQEDHCQLIIYKHLLPYMESNNEDESYFQQDGLEYIRRLEDMTVHPFRQASLDLIKSIMVYMHFGTKAEIIKFVEYASGVLQQDSNSTNRQKQVILLILSYLSRQIMKNKYLKQNFQNLVQVYFLNLARSSNDIISAHTIRLLNQYLQLTTLSTATIRELLSLLYEKMTGTNMVVKFFSMLAFTKLLDDKDALDQTRPHFQNILQIYVKMLDSINHEKLIGSLEAVVKSFSNEIVTYAKDLCSHLFNLFHSYHNTDQEGDDGEGQNNQATAALSTIKQILNSPLPADSYYAISQNVMVLLQNLCSEYDDYLQDILNMFNVLIYESANIVDFQFPYLLFLKLLQGNNAILNNCQNQQFIKIVGEAQKADSEYSEVLISILKNLIQKMPDSLLHKYPYPSNPELLLCLIENKKIPLQALGNLDTSGLDQQWNLILQSYTAMIYGVGEICNLSQLKMLNGVSLYPWIEHRMDLDVVKRVLFMIEDEEGDDDDLEEENTMQMLQKFADEDDEDQNEQFYISDGGNYSINYDSPFDSSKDKIHLANKLKLLSNNDLAYLVSQLKPRYKAKLETILTQ